MGHSQEEKEKNHQRIVESPRGRIRESGTDGPGVAEIMNEAGLTHGGFYKHFDSRDDLVAEAVDAAIEQGSRASTEGRGGRRPARRLPRRSTSPTEHRDDPGTGCPVVALGADVAARRRPRPRRLPRPGRAATSPDLEDLLGDGEDAPAAARSPPSPRWSARSSSRAPSTTPSSPTRSSPRSAPRSRTCNA